MRTAARTGASVTDFVFETAEGPTSEVLPVYYSGELCNATQGLGTTR